MNSHGIATASFKCLSSKYQVCENDVLPDVLIKVDKSNVVTMSYNKWNVIWKN